jgi:hypothetical protein
MLVINTGVLSSLFINDPCFFTMTNPSPEYIPVIYLLGIVGRTIEVISEEALPKYLILNFDFAICEAALLGLSLLINICATSIIALKAW